MKYDACVEYTVMLELFQGDGCILWLDRLELVKSHGIEIIRAERFALMDITAAENIFRTISNFREQVVKSTYL